MLIPTKENTLQFSKKAWFLAKRTFQLYFTDRVTPLGASLAYYTIFSLPALLIIMIALVGIFFGEKAVEGQVFERLKGFVGEGVALQVQMAVAGIGNHDDNTLAAIGGSVVLFFAATGVFSALQGALNQIFGVYQGREPHFLQVVIDKLFTFGMVLLMGGLLTVALISSALAGIITSIVQHNETWLQSKLAEGFQFAGLLLHYSTSTFFWALDIFLTFGMLTLVFVTIYKVLPDARIRWRYAIPASILVTGLFIIGKNVLIWYFTAFQLGSAYGAAGTLLVLLLWVFYSSQLLFIGAEFIKAMAEWDKEPIPLRAYANKVLESAFANRLRAHFNRKKP